MPYFGKSLLGGLSAPVYWLYRLWCRSLRYTEINRATIENTADQGRPVVLSLWHDELFPLIYLKRQLNIIALVSQSDDGDLLAGVQAQDIPLGKLAIFHTRKPLFRIKRAANGDRLRLCGLITARSR